MQLNQLLLLLLGDAEADKLGEARLHEVVHPSHETLQHLKSTGAFWDGSCLIRQKQLSWCWSCRRLLI